MNPAEPKVLVFVVMAPAVKGSGEKADRMVGLFRHNNREGAETLANHEPGGYVLPKKVAKSLLPW